MTPEDRIPSVFDAHAWATTVESALADPERIPGDRIRGDIWRQANEALNLERACDTTVDGDDYATVLQAPYPTERLNPRGVIDMHRLDKNEVIVTIRCTILPHQTANAFVWIKGKQATVLLAPVAPDKSWLRAAIVGAEYDKRTRILSAFEKPTGRDDCGTYTTYQFGPGSVLQIDKIRQLDCQETPTIPFRPPSEWPVTYPTLN